MTLLFYFFLAGLLLLLNAFFVLAEFAMVKMRTSRVEELIDRGRKRARLVRNVQGHLDEYLSVCQVGITFASIGLGFVGEPAFAQLIINVTGLETAAAHGIAVGVAYVLVSFLHIVLGELVPKSLAIRRTEGSALVTAFPLKIFHWVFYVPLVILNGSANGILWLMGLPRTVREPEHSEDELRIILAQSQSSGLLSFRRLLFLENIFDLGDMRVRDVMRSREAVKVLQAGTPWEESFRKIREARYSRYPLVDGTAEMPLGVVHVKDLFLEGGAEGNSVDLRKFARAYVVTPEDTPLENLLGELQRHRGHLAIVKNAEGKWSGIVTLEDVAEEILGSIEDEFEQEPPLYLTDTMTAEGVVLGIRAGSLEEGIRQAFSRITAKNLPCPLDQAMAAVLQRERSMSTYLGNNLAVPHARLEGLSRPALFFARSDEGIPVGRPDEKAHFLFILLTPASAPRMQVRLLARICGLLESDYVADRLKVAETPAAVIDTMRAAGTVVL